MKTPSDQLFQFIRSFDTNEKIYIKKNFSAHYSDSNSEKLFDYLCACEQYDEPGLLKSLPFLSRTTIKHAKQNLFDYLLKKLGQYYAETDEEQELQKLLFQVKILRRKQFYKKAYQLLNHALDRAKEYELVTLQAEIQLEQKILANIIKRPEKTWEYEQQTAIDILAYHFREEYFARTMIIEITSFGLDTYKTADEIERTLRYFYSQAIAKKKEQNYTSLPDKIKLRFDFIEYYCLHLLHDNTTAIKCFSALLKRYEKINLKTIAAKQQFLNNLVSGSSISSYCKNEKLMLAINKKADELVYELREKDFNMVTTYYFGVKGNLIYFLIKKNDFIAAKRESLELLKKINLQEMLYTYQKVFLTNLTGIYLCCGEAREALNTYNLIATNSLLMGIRIGVDDTTYTTNLLVLAIYYDLKLWSNLKSLYGSCCRDKELENQPAIYRQLIEFFGALLKTKDDAAGTKKTLENIVNIINRVVKLGQDRESLLLNERLEEVRYWLNVKLKES